MTDETKAKIRDINDRLNEIAPYPTPETLTAAGLARYLAAKAQVAYWMGLDPAADLLSYEATARMVAEFAAAHALFALAEVDPDQANTSAAQIFDAWEDGAGIGEWLWAHLGEETCEAVSALAGELSAAQAEAKAVTADA